MSVLGFSEEELSSLRFYVQSYVSLGPAPESLFTDDASDILSNWIPAPSTSPSSESVPYRVHVAGRKKIGGKKSFHRHYLLL